MVILFRLHLHDQFEMMLKNIQMYLSDEVIYVCLLLISIPTGFVFKNSRHINFKAWSSTFIGFLFALIVCRWDVLHSLITTSVTCLILASVTAR